MKPRNPPPPPERRDTGNPVAEACGEVLEHAADWGLDLLQAAGKGMAETAGSAVSAAGEVAGTVATATGEAAGAVVEAVGSIAP